MSPLRVVCAWCRREQVDGVFAEPVSSSPAPRDTTHTICPDCLELIAAEHGLDVGDEQRRRCCGAAS